MGIDKSKVLPASAMEYVASERTDLKNYRLVPVEVFSESRDSHLEILASKAPEGAEVIVGIRVEYRTSNMAYVYGTALILRTPKEIGIINSSQPEGD